MTPICKLSSRHDGSSVTFHYVTEVHLCYQYYWLSVAKKTAVYTKVVVTRIRVKNFLETRSKYSRLRGTT
jgi:hypothetical protein